MPALTVSAPRALAPWQILALAAAGVATVLTTVWASTPAQWDHAALIVGLGVMATLMSLLPAAMGTTSTRFTGSFFPLFLLMALAGPAPAVAAAIVAETVASIVRPPSITPRWAACLGNVLITAAYCLAGGLLLGALNDSSLPTQCTSMPPGMRCGAALSTLFGVYLLVHWLNFELMRGLLWVMRRTEDMPPYRALRDTTGPTLVAGAAAAAAISGYEALGWMALLLTFIVGGMYQHTIIRLVQTQRAARQLAEYADRITVLQQGTLQAMIAALRLRDPLLPDHCARVAELSTALATRSGRFDAAEIEEIRLAALLHDIGMFSLPDGCLIDPHVGEDDMALIREHPRRGADLAALIPGMEHVARLIAHHHETPDGTGYPHGCTDSPFGAQLIAVAETFDALTSIDYYRTPLPEADALIELQAHPGQFCADVVSLLADELADRRQRRFSDRDGREVHPSRPDRAPAPPAAAEVTPPAPSLPRLVAERAAAMVQAIFEDLGACGQVELIVDGDEQPAVSYPPNPAPGGVAARTRLLDRLRDGDVSHVADPARRTIAVRDPKTATVIILHDHHPRLDRQRAAARLIDQAHRWSRWRTAADERIDRVGRRVLLGAQVRDAERRRLAYDLHGGVAQELAAALITADMLDGEALREDVDVLLGHVGRANAQLRGLLTELYRTDGSPRLDEAVERLCERYRTRLAAKSTTLGLRIAVTQPLRRTLRETALYVLREALHNVYEHAQASHADVVVRCDDDGLHVVVCDDGCGFTTLRTDGDDAHLGVAGIREHIAALDGRCDISSSPGRGTTVHVQLPLHAAVGSTSPMLSVA